MHVVTASITHGYSLHHLRLQGQLLGALRVLLAPVTWRAPVGVQAAFVEAAGRLISQLLLGEGGRGGGGGGCSDVFEAGMPPGAPHQP